MIKINLVGKGASASRIIYLAQTILQFGAAVSSIALNATDISNGPTNTGVSVGLGCCSCLCIHRLMGEFYRVMQSLQAVYQQSQRHFSLLTSAFRFPAGSGSLGS